VTTGCRPPLCFDERARVRRLCVPEGSTQFAYEARLVQVRRSVAGDAGGIGLHPPFEPLQPDLVEACRESLGQPTGVGEHDRGPVRGDQVDDPFFDVGPDRGALGLPGSRSSQVAGRLSDRGQIRHGDHDLQIPALLARRGDEGDVASAGEEAGHLIDRANRR